MRLIDADAFKEYVCNAYEQVKHMYPDGGEWARQITEDLCKEIDEQPTIDISNNSNTLGALDCIDRHKAINIRFSEGFDHDGILYVPWKDVEAHLKELPSVKPEFQEWQKIILSKLMVIRCKDCKNWVIGKTTKNYPNPYICDLHSFMHGFERSALPEDYCSWAELKGEEAKEGGDKGC